MTPKETGVEALSNVTSIAAFMKDGGSATDAQLSDMIRSVLANVSAQDRQDWVRQTELSLDGYGGARNATLVQRVTDALKLIKAELSIS